MDGVILNLLNRVAGFPKYAVDANLYRLGCSILGPFSKFGSYFKPGSVLLKGFQTHPSPLLYSKVAKKFVSAKRYAM